MKKGGKSFDPFCAKDDDLREMQQFGRKQKTSTKLATLQK
jgi:hypothetical protein